MNNDTPAQTNHTANRFSAADNMPDGNHSGYTSPVASMTDEVKRVLVYLLRQGVVLAATKPKIFDVLCRHQISIRRHLADVYLSLVLDERQGVAFVSAADHPADNAEADTSEEEAENAPVSLISRRTLTLFDTLLLLMLRKHYQERETAGEQKIIIDLERISANLSPFLPLTDHAALEKKRLTARVNAMIERKLLSTVRNEEERYEITPLIRYVVNAEMLNSLLAQYQHLLAEKTQSENVERPLE